MDDEPKLVPDSKYSPIGDTEPYDTYIDDKLTEEDK
jgi:hypothetical protein